ncbi:MAG: hypothetical protein JWN17_3075 [Frankiales bacterium]|nr:hypothetical protein [Frankiales bacterium]
MRKQIVTVALAGSLGLAGAAFLPSLASADTATGTATTNPVTSRLQAFKDALKGLVSDDTLTQAQADKVASTLADKLPARGPGGPGGRGDHGPRGAHLSPEATAKAAGVSVAELRAGRQAGKTLAQIAATKGVSKADLVDRLVAAEKTELAAAVKDGRITQAQSDEVQKTLVAETTEHVDDVRGPGGPGGRGHGPDGDADDDGAPAAPSTGTTPSGTGTTSTTPSVGA